MPAKAKDDEVVIEREVKEEKKEEVERQDYKIEVIDGTFLPYSFKGLTWAKQMPVPFSAEDGEGEEGDYYAIDAEGKHFAISAADLAEKYSPVSEAKRITHGPLKFGDTQPEPESE